MKKLYLLLTIVCVFGLTSAIAQQNAANNLAEPEYNEKPLQVWSETFGKDSLKSKEFVEKYQIIFPADAPRTIQKREEDSVKSPK
jgi:hypothetical protein